MRFGVLLAALSANLLAPAAAQSLQLANGQILLATVEEADGDGLRVHRLDNGGALDLRWDHLTPASANKWKRKFDLIGDTEDELMTRAVEVFWLINGTRQSVIGHVVDRGADPVVVSVKGQPYRVPRRDLVNMREIEVPATQVYTLEEYYQQRLDEISPGDQADKHMLLAEDLIKFHNYDRAQEHLERARQLGNSKNPAFLDTLDERLKRFKEAAKEFGLLDRIRACRSRGKLPDFERGREMIAQFEKDFPQTRLKSEFDREKARFEQARTRYLTQQVADQWRRALSTIAGKKVTEDGFGLQQAKDYAENKMTDDVVARLQQSLHLEVDEIKQMWQDRAKYPVGKRTEHFSYGIGSWVLGDQAILKDTAAGEATQSQQENKVDNANPQIQRFAKMLQEAMQRRQRAQGGGQQAQEQSDEDWWREASRGERIGWLRAYYAEFSGQMVIKFATASPCISCFGDGSTTFIGGDGKPGKIKCFLCQGTKWTRSFKAY
ncbi:MAG: hypothetical protein H6835_12785 [Planctomycetes bacterium]|nr:hypothetical protein [Planctomycetota bacterium]